jgi:hypothetical protein
MQKKQQPTNEIEINKNTFSRFVDYGMAFDTYMEAFAHGLLLLLC